MDLIYILIQIIYISLIIISSSKETNEKKIYFSIMSHNVRNIDDTLRYNQNGSVAVRLPRVIKNILHYSPDTVGLQEITAFKNRNSAAWYPNLNESLNPKYTAVGIMGSGQGQGLYGTPIYVNTEKLEILESGTKWLSPTPDIKSKFENTTEHPTDGAYEIFTYVIVRRKDEDFTYMHINTHLDYKSWKNRISEAEVIKNFTDKYKNKYPIIITGDFNSINGSYSKLRDVIPWMQINGFILSSTETNDSLHHNTFRQIGYYKDVYATCKKRGYHTNKKNLTEQVFCDGECDAENGKVIDYCLRVNISNMKFTKYMVLTDFNISGGISSDHYPIYSEGYFIKYEESGSYAFLIIVIFIILIIIGIDLYFNWRKRKTQIMGLFIKIKLLFKKNDAEYSFIK